MHNGVLSNDDIEDCSDEDSEVDSLFDSASPLLDHFPELSNTKATPPCHHDAPVAQRTKPSIPGLFFDPSVLIPEELASSLIEHTTQQYFCTRSGAGNVNQVMLFGRASDHGSGLPPFLDDLIVALSSLLKRHLPSYAYALLFPPGSSPLAPASRQAILNHYTPGEGITPHVDLLTRFADGIIGVSLGSGTVMTFQRVSGGQGETASESGKTDRWDVYLPERSVLVLTGDARYKWSHGIERRSGDRVAGDTEGKTFWIERGTRVSVTLRWLLPGADIVGSPL